MKKGKSVRSGSGWDVDHIYAVDNAKAIQTAGAKALAIHGRTRRQLYEGYVDWDIIQQVNQAA